MHRALWHLHLCAHHLGVKSPQNFTTCRPLQLCQEAARPHGAYTTVTYMHKECCSRGPQSSTTLHSKNGWHLWVLTWLYEACNWQLACCDTVNAQLGRCLQDGHRHACTRGCSTFQCCLGPNNSCTSKENGYPCGPAMQHTNHKATDCPCGRLTDHPCLPDSSCRVSGAMCRTNLQVSRPWHECAFLSQTAPTPQRRVDFQRLLCGGAGYHHIFYVADGGHHLQAAHDACMLHTIFGGQ